MSNNTGNYELIGHPANKNVITGVIFGFVIVVVAVIVSMVSCRPTSSPTPGQTDEALVIIGIDRSGSTEVQRPAQREAAEAATFFADENRIKLGFYAVDKKAVSIQEPNSLAPGLPESVAKELDTKPKTRSTGTRPLAFWREMKERFGNNKYPTFIAYLTDGGNDYASDTDEITSTLRSLGENPNIHVAILGVTPDLLTAVRRDLAPFGSKGKQSVRNDQALRSDLMTFLGDLE